MFQFASANPTTVLLPPCAARACLLPDHRARYSIVYTATWPPHYCALNSAVICTFYHSRRVLCLSCLHLPQRRSRRENSASTCSNSDGFILVECWLLRAPAGYPRTLGRRGLRISPSRSCSADGTWSVTSCATCTTCTSCGSSGGDASARWALVFK